MRPKHSIEIREEAEGNINRAIYTIYDQEHSQNIPKYKFMLVTDQESREISVKFLPEEFNIYQELLTDEPEFQMVLELILTIENLNETNCLVGTEFRTISKNVRLILTELNELNVLESERLIFKENRSFTFELMKDFEHTQSLI
jgi:hypothetical protein